MNIYRTQSEQVLKTAQVNKQLKSGQIIQGKIQQLYPDNKAQVQLGNQTLIAKLEAPLIAGERYHFQVQRADQMIHLKVLGERLTGKAQENITQLLQQLGLKSTKENSILLLRLVKNGLPFDKKQLSKAIQLLGQKENGRLAQEVILQMITRRYPMKESIFQALYTEKTTQQSEVMQNLLLKLREDSAAMSNNKAILIARLQSLLYGTVNEKEYVLNNIRSDTYTESNPFFQVLKSVGVVNSDLSLSSWKSMWGNASVSSQKGKDWPLNVTPPEIMNILKNLLANKQEVMQLSLELLAKLQKRSQSSATNSETREIQAQLIKIAALLHNRVDLRANYQQFDALDIHILQRLETLSNPSSYVLIENIIKNMEIGSSHNLPGKHFLNQVKHYLSLSGITYENDLLNKINQPQTVKELLISMIPQSDGTVHELATKALNHLNGLQLQSVFETEHFIQTAIHIPAYKPGINKDLKIEFESKKTSDGKIDPDHCRILFYLELKNLNETIMDIHIQQRSVSITVFNDNEKAKLQVAAFQPLLKTSLERMNYHLSGISFKPLQDKPNISKQIINHYSSSSYQGVDYLI
ncbi:hypothetical protein D8M04_10625 [Oceanobacillus piezotolerans]|uniref:Flagellar hook-length control protein FliK n=1 Tax=Oceanobacillus piezotolerans TaxID=2448030 RepID=A0A498D9J7_9BACI|nr:hypothetical protein [Oceanobacillus piezotolerans]RLL45301.1 hypothetical protein D8M04_10625 [Oceanobacillus piezotolerans]